jgi:hypothetical protein
VPAVRAPTEAWEKGQRTILEYREVQTFDEFVKETASRRLPFEIREQDRRGHAETLT